MGCIAARTNVATITTPESSLIKPFFSWKSKYLTMSCSDDIGTETMELSLAVLEVI